MCSFFVSAYQCNNKKFLIYAYFKLVFLGIIMLTCSDFFKNSCVLQGAMRKAEALSTKECPVKIKLVAPPAYVLTTQTLDKVLD